ncbi:MAG: hypothetical protein II007_09595 [Gammaproteobacteria bacterium]|nr:hypothetical protein [Gammaproteobacteria bacterium]
MPISEGVIDESALSETIRDPLQIPDFLYSFATHSSGFSPSRPSSSPTSEVLSPELIAQCLEPTSQLVQQLDILLPGDKPFVASSAVVQAVSGWVSARRWHFSSKS